MFQIKLLYPTFAVPALSGSDSSVLMIGVKQRMMRQHAGTDARTLGLDAPKKPPMTSFPWADHQSLLTHQTETEPSVHLATTQKTRATSQNTLDQ